MSPRHICQTSDLLILGAGITGLAAAYYLKDACDLRVLEASNELGGVIRTHQQEGYLLESGPDCFMNQKPQCLELAKAIGLHDDIIESQDQNRRVLILREGQLHHTDYSDKAVTEFLGNRAQTNVNPAPFLSFKNGMQAFPQALASQLGERIVPNTPITSIKYADNYWQVGNFKARAVLSTLPAAQTAKLLGVSWPQFGTVSTTSAYLAYKREDIAHSLDAFGVMLPAAENRKISAVTIVSSKFKNRCPDGTVLFRAFTKNAPADARTEIENLFKPGGRPVLEKHFTVKYADPKYASDHAAQVRTIEASLPANFFIAGSPYRGVGLADCIEQAQRFKLARHFER